jgi:hypothetical protein
MVQGFFSSIQERIISEIDNAQNSILIAVAWFNNREIYNALLNKAKTGIKIELIIVNDEVNNKSGGLDYQRLIDSDVRFYFADSARLMHNKFSIYDGETLLNGSYNWTHAAERRNKENLIIIKNEQDLIKQFNNQFEQLKPSKPVLNVREYLKKNPPAVNALTTEVLFVDEVIIELSLYDDIPLDNQMEMVDRALDYYPKNTELVEKKRKIYETYSESLQEFCIKYSDLFLNQIRENYHWTPATLELYGNKIDKGYVQRNEATEWTYDLINQFREILFHPTVRTMNFEGNPQIGLQSSFWGNANIYLSINEINQIRDGLLIRYQYLRDKCSSFDETQCDPDKPFYINRIPANYPKRILEITEINDQTDFNLLAKSKNFPWTEELLAMHLDRIDWWWSNITWNYVPWTLSLVQRVKELKPSQFSKFCIGVKLTEHQVEEFKDILDWEGIIKNRGVCVSQAFFQKYKVYLLPHLKLMSNNSGFEWTEDFISKHHKTLSFEDLSGNPALPWSSKLIRMYKDKWCYSDLCINKHITWTPDMLEELKDKLDWDRAAGNTSIPWTMKMIEEYSPLRKSDRYFSNFATNKTVWENVFKKHVNEDFLTNIAPLLKYEESINSY